ncbi:hypothetical protein DXT99_17770 [Pontibacter diazotrophicus]|uniref:Glycine zipper family protein n=1 Tax=Pontibacter diazotrophicus TaxID=1400979 RepID=A0A3D8L8Z7_9BACT|nr:hypothetical protein [Pontibacter diazotrophicus]RDV13875.1 hypothetical protein DXT99_17770 [Pontibacter diazotrophicus]
MKQLLFVLLVLSYFCCTAQNRNNDNSVLLLSKNGASNPRELSIKLNKQIEVKMLDGRKLTLTHYSLVGDSAIAFSTDTLALRDITSIKGTVKGNILRKVGGNVLAAGAGAYGAAAVALGLGTMMAGGGLPFFLLAVPAFGITYGGSKLAGPRRFDTSEKWTLNISPKVE